MRAIRVEEIPPTSLARIGSFEGDLEKALANFSSEFYIRASQPHIQVYGLFYAGENPYLLNVFGEKKAITRPEDYNTLLIITSRSTARNQQVVEEFQQTTGIDFQRPAPIINLTSPSKLGTYGMIFDILLDKPDEAMELLKELERRTEVE